LFQSGSTTNDSSSAVKLEKGSIVTLKCRLKPEGDFVPEPLIDGVVLHDEDPPQTLTFVLGYGNYLPGIHEMLLSSSSPLQAIGDSVQEMSLDAGWGARNPDLVAKIKFDGSGIDKSQIKVGVELFLANGVKCAVTEVGDESFTIDANPPMAGASYLATLELVNVEEGPKELFAPYSEEEPKGKYQYCTFGLGCFWGGELEFMRGTCGVLWFVPNIESN